MDQRVTPNDTVIPPFLSVISGDGCRRHLLCELVPIPKARYDLLGRQKETRQR
jgi:hypothetical protein